MDEGGRSVEGPWLQQLQRRPVKEPKLEEQPQKQRQQTR